MVPFAIIFFHDFQDNYHADTMVVYQEITLSMNSMKESFQLHHKIPSLLTYRTLISLPTAIGVSHNQVNNLKTPLMESWGARMCFLFRIWILK